MAIAVVDNQISGFIVAFAGNANRNRHAAYMVIGVQQSCWGQGVGSALIEYMETWVKASYLHRVEFTVMENNTAARSLYRKHGYAEEGVKLDSLKVNGTYVNELYMGKLF